MRKLISASAILFSTILLTGATDLHYVINAQANATRHNNTGLEWLKEKYYFGAIKEFEMAIDLNPNTQATSVYYNNLGRTYMTIGYPELAESKFQNAIRKYPLNFEFYLNLVDAYGKTDKVDKMLTYYTKNRKNSLDDIMIALLYGAKGEIRTEVTMLDEFCNNEPDLIITPAIRKYLKEQAGLLKYDSELFK